MKTRGRRVPTVAGGADQRPPQPGREPVENQGGFKPCRSRDVRSCTRSAPAPPALHRRARPGEASLFGRRFEPYAQAVDPCVILSSNENPSARQGRAVRRPGGVRQDRGRAATTSPAADELIEAIARRSTTSSPRTCSSAAARRRSCGRARTSSPRRTAPGGHDPDLRGVRRLRRADGPPQSAPSRSTPTSRWISTQLAARVQGRRAGLLLQSEQPGRPPPSARARHDDLLATLDEGRRRRPPCWSTRPTSSTAPMPGYDTHHPARRRESARHRGAHLLEVLRHGGAAHRLRHRPPGHDREDGGLGRHRPDQHHGAGWCRGGACGARQLGQGRAEAQRRRPLRSR